jgi:CRISPR-associated exonuclease Cas4
VPEGSLFYAETKRRIAVAFDTELRGLTEATVSRLRGLREVFATGLTPAAEYRADKCRACSLIELCRPKAVVRPARAWRDRMVAAVLAGEAEP